MPDLDRITAGSEQARPPVFKVGLDTRGARVAAASEYPKGTRGSLPDSNKNNDSREFVDVILHDKQDN